VARDRLMVEMDALYPGYGFAGHKGYGAPTHISALERLGPCEIHRHAWSPVQKVLRGESIRVEIEVEILGEASAPLSDQLQPSCSTSRRR